MESGRDFPRAEIVRTRVAGRFASRTESAGSDRKRSAGSPERKSRQTMSVVAWTSQKCRETCREVFAQHSQGNNPRDQATTEENCHGILLRRPAQLNTM